MRPRKKDRHLPARVYFKNGAYWYVEKNKWQRLSSDLASALHRYAELVDATYSGGMSELIDKVLAHIEPQLATNTVKQYKVAAAKLKPILVEFSPSQVLPRHIAQIKLSMASTPNMANRCLSFLRVVFSYAVEWQLCDSNPCIGIKRHAEKKRDRYITDAEFIAIKSAAEHRAIPAIMDLCFLTGQRISDVLSIKNQDISSDCIRIVQQKTKTKLAIAMTDDLAATIHAIRESHPPLKGVDHLLYSRNRDAYAYGTIKDAFERARTSAGIVGVTLHDIRAKSLTDADLQGLNAQKLGGHSDPRMTDRYIRRRRSSPVLGPSSPASE